MLTVQIFLFLLTKENFANFIHCKAGTVFALGDVGRRPGFDINIGTDEFTTIGLHISVRFDSVGDHNTVVCNTFQHHQWGQEVRERSFPFCQGQEFKISVTSQECILMSYGSTINFPNRFCAKEYSVMDLEGKVRFTSLQIK
uniref:Galectin n=1 Tax=Salarias fasciatus TaxID=181472 RepID=A0A672FRP7_SALFA